MKLAITGIILSVLAGACAQLLMKSGMLHLPAGAFKLSFRHWQLHPQGPVLIISGISCYVMAVFTWMLALRRFELNAIYPILALGYVVVYIAAAYIPGLAEPITIQKSMGIALIIFGVIWSCYGTEKPHS